MTKNFAANLKIGGVLSSSVGRVFGGLNRKIKEQESTLKGLRAAYKDAAKGTGEYAGRLDELKAKTAAAEREMKRLRAAANFDVGKSLRGVGSTFEKDAARAGIVGGIVGAAGVGIAKNMLDITASFEKALTVLKTVEGSGEKAEQSFAWIQSFAQKTPFELQQVLDSFVKLRAYGIDPIGGDTLRIIGDTASAMGKDVNDAVEAIADAVTGENERLKEFGIKAAKEGSKITYEYTDRAGKQMRKTVNANSRAQIQATLLAIWNSKFKGAMDDQSKTWNGMVSNMQDAWAKFAYEIMRSGPFEHLKVKLGDFLKQVEVWSNDGTLAKKAEEIGSKITTAATAIWDFGAGVFKAVNYVQELLGGWDKLGIAIIALNFAPTIVAIGQLTRGLWLMSGASWAVAGPIGLVALGVGALFLAIMAIVDPGGPLDLLGRVFPETMQKIREALESAVNFISDKIDLVIQKIRELFEWFDKLTGLDTAGFFMGGPTSNYDPKKYMLPGAPLGGAAPSLAPAGKMPSPLASEIMLQDYLKTGGQNNTFNINVTAPGGDGQRIADQIRSEFNRRPLFDTDGALSPAR